MSDEDRDQAVADLLVKSIQAHERYRHAKPKFNPTSKTADLGSPSAARAALMQAADCRQQAHERDPKHEAPAWAATAATHPHDALVSFYASELAK